MYGATEFVKGIKFQLECVHDFLVPKILFDEKLKSYLHNGTDKSLRSNREKIQLSECLKSCYVLHARFVDCWWNNIML